MTVMTAGSARRRRSLSEVRRVRLTRRGRMAVAGLMVAGALMAAAPAWLPATASAQVTGGGAPAGSVYRNLTQVVVHPGQTLWSIAVTSEPAADPRTVIQQIITLNALPGTSLQPGERLWVPRG